MATRKNLEKNKEKEDTTIITITIAIKRQDIMIGKIDTSINLDSITMKTKLVIIHKSLKCPKN